MAQYFIAVISRRFEKFSGLISNCIILLFRDDFIAQVKMCTEKEVGNRLGVRIGYFRCNREVAESNCQIG